MAKMTIILVFMIDSIKGAMMAGDFNSVRGYFERGGGQLIYLQMTRIYFTKHMQVETGQALHSIPTFLKNIFYVIC